MDLLKPRRLRPGDTVAIVSPSWGGPASFPAAYEAGLRALRDIFGLEVKEMPTARMTPRELYADPKARAQDLNDAFSEPRVKAIVASIGGDDSLRILPHLDAAAARANPKILMGYSDTAIETIFYHLSGLVTYNGPAVMAGFAQVEAFGDTAVHHIKAMLFDAPASYDYQPYPQWSNNYADWREASNAGKVALLQDHDGWHWLQGGARARARGRLFGGCIEVLEFLKGTQYWPSPDFWQDRVLFLETSEDKPSITQVKRWLRNYGVQGVLGRLSGLLVGRARDYSPAEKSQLDDAILSVVAGEFGVTDLTIVTNLDFGHTDPQWILPLGLLMEIDPLGRTLRLVESPTL